MTHHIIVAFKRNIAHTTTERHANIVYLIAMLVQFLERGECCVAICAVNVGVSLTTVYHVHVVLLHRGRRVLAFLTNVRVHLKRRPPLFGAQK